MDSPERALSPGEQMGPETLAPPEGMRIVVPGTRTCVPMRSSGVTGDPVKGGGEPLRSLLAGERAPGEVYVVLFTIGGVNSPVNTHILLFKTSPITLEA